MSAPAILPAPRSALWQELSTIALLTAVALAIGLASGQALAAASVALAAYLLWQLLNLWRLLIWLHQGAGSAPGFHGLARELALTINDILVSRARGKGKRSRVLKRMREAMAALPDAAVILDRSGRIEWSNPASRQLLGTDWPKGNGGDISQLIPNPEFHQYLASGETAKLLEIPSPGANGLYLAVRITRFGKKHQRLLIARDITALRNLDHVRRDFIANVSHELRTPLTVINGFLETMAEDAAECPQWARSVELMEQQSRRMQTLVNDLLTLSRLEMDRGNEEPPETVAVPALLASVLDEARSIGANNHHQIELRADPTLWLLGNPGQLQSVCSNLVINAVQHTPAGTHITIDWQRIGDQAVFSVSDDGDGIPSQHLARLTERFYRVDKARSRRKGGTGLGLAIVKHALARHHSELEVSSRDGAGARFECRFPGDRITAPPAKH